MKTINIGTRGSKLALIQALMVKEWIQSFETFSPDIIEIRTKGDIFKSQAISDIGTKNVFANEIQEKLEKKNIDVASHSLKDLSATTKNPFKIQGILGGESRNDTIVHKGDFDPNQKERNYVFATGSPRRTAQLKILYPNCKIQPIRGNVPTRIAQLKNNPDWTGVILSQAGLYRLNIKPKHHYIFKSNEIVPAGGQGLIAIETLNNRPDLDKLFNKLTENPLYHVYRIEMGFLKAVQATCQSPVGICVSEDLNEANLFYSKTTTEPFLKTSININNGKSVEDKLKLIIQEFKKQWQKKFNKPFANDAC
jgi:hydroxymethylbilane synthase